MPEPKLILEGLSPEWKFYPVNNGGKAVAFDNQIFVADRDYIVPEELFSLSPRPQGTGYKRGKELRFVPLIEVYDEKELRSGFLAWMMVNSNAQRNSRAYEASVIAGFGTSDPAFYNNEGIAAVVDVARTMLNGTLFVEAGATEYLYVESETVTIPLGANIRGKNNEGLTVEVSLYKDGESIYQSEHDMSGVSGANGKHGVSLFNIETSYNISDGNPDRVGFTLKQSGETLDFISHEIVVWSPKPESERIYHSRKQRIYARRQTAQALRHKLYAQLRNRRKFRKSCVFRALCVKRSV
jgi:hypothetical protein